MEIQLRKHAQSQAVYLCQGRASKTPNFQFPELVIQQDLLSAMFGAAWQEDGGCVCSAAQSSVKGTGGITWSRSVALTVRTGAPTAFTMLMEAE